jgi:hypothetical protein
VLADLGLGNTEDGFPYAHRGAGGGGDERISGECRSGRLGAVGQVFQRGSGSALTGVIVVVQTFMPGCKNSLSFSRSSVSTTM